jgi:hypothetical protein
MNTADAIVAIVIVVSIFVTICIVGTKYISYITKMNELKLENNAELGKLALQHEALIVKIHDMYISSPHKVDIMEQLGTDMDDKMMRAYEKGFARGVEKTKDEVKTIIKRIR